jgi:hypothetical protein
MEGVSLLEILLWVTLSVQTLPLAIARGKNFMHKITNKTLLKT